MSNWEELPVLPGPIVAYRRAMEKRRSRLRRNGRKFAEAS